jgi:signal transduction histidine kinase
MKRILVIEDTPEVREIIASTLQSKGWEPLLAENGEEGVALANAMSPDLILCDIRMPKMDGYAVLQELRSKKSTAVLPFIFLSGLGERPEIRHGMNLGADDYIQKPFTPNELISAVEARLHKQNVVTESAEIKMSQLRESLSFALPHELGTPLNTILGFSSLITDATELSLTEVREYAGYIHSAGQRLQDLTEKFLLYAQLELMSSDEAQIKGLSEKPAAPTLDIVLTASEKSARQLNRGEDLKFNTIEFEHRIGAAHLERMLKELISNACNFSEPGTPIQVTTRGGKQEFELRVSDKGKGFTGEQLRRVTANMQFDRRLQEQQGVGLGLAITRKLAELYGGTLRILSVPEKETTVSIHLPV